MVSPSGRQHRPCPCGSCPIGSTGSTSGPARRTLAEDDGSPGSSITRSPTRSSAAPLLHLRGRAGRRGGSPSRPQVSLPVRRPERGAADGAPSSAQGWPPILSVCAKAWEAPSPRAVSAPSTRWPRATKPSRWSRNSPGACGIVATRCTAATEPESGPRGAATRRLGVGHELRRGQRPQVGRARHVCRFRYPSRLTLAWRLASRTAAPSTNGVSTAAGN